MAGRPPKEKSFANMLRIAVMAADETADTKRPKLRSIAEKLVESALEGKMDAIKEIADRLDGKPAQAIVGDSEHDAIQLVARIERHIVKADR